MLIYYITCIYIDVIILMIVKVSQCIVKAQYPQRKSLVCEGNKEYNYESNTMCTYIKIIFVDKLVK